MDRSPRIRSARVVSILVAGALVAAVASLAMSSTTASAQSESPPYEWTVFVNGTTVNKATRVGTDPETEFNSLSITTNQGQAKFHFNVEPDGSITQVGGLGVYYPDPTWHLEGSYDGVEFNCDPPVEPRDGFETTIAGTMTETEFTFTLDLPGSGEQNDEMECSSNFTAFAADLQYLRESLQFCGQVRMPLADFARRSCRKSQITVDDMSSPTKGRIKREITHTWDLTLQRYDPGSQEPSPTPSQSTIPSPTPSGSPGASPTPGPSSNLRGSLLVVQKHVKATGAVTLRGWGAPECVDSVPVLIERRRGSSWRTVETVETEQNGMWSAKIDDAGGRYRALAPEVVIGQAVCRQAISGIKEHNHN